MNRNVFLIFLAIILGLAAGWFLWARFSGLPEGSTVNPNATEKVTKAKSKAGYCCTKPGNRCDQVEDPDICFRAGGKAFNAQQRNCDYYCLNVKP